MQFQARLTPKKKREKEASPVLKQEDTKRDGKEDTKGKRHKGTSPCGKSNKPVCVPLSEGAMPKGIRVRLWAHTRMLTLQI